MLKGKSIQSFNSRIVIQGLILCCGLLLQDRFTFADSFSGTVTRSLFTTELKKTEPVNEALVLENNIRDIYFFSEVEGMKGRTIIHRWEYRGETVFENKFKITQELDKQVSKYTLSPDRTGEWMVVIADERGWPIKAVMFKYVNKGSFAGKGIVPLESRF